MSAAPGSVKVCDAPSKPAVLQDSASTPSAAAIPPELSTAAQQFAGDERERISCLRLNEVAAMGQHADQKFLRYG